MSRQSKKTSDINDVREMALELEQYRQMVDDASDAVVTINEHHEIVYFNDMAERMFGYEREEVIGGDLSFILPTEHRKNHRHYVERYIKTRKARMIGHSAEVIAERRDGTRFPVSISFSQAETGMGLLFTAIMRDLSAERNLVERVRQAESLAGLGSMVATVSHEIKTPLVLIGGFARQVAKEAGLSSKGRRKMDIIVSEVERLENILNEIGDLSRPQQYNWAEVDVCGLAEGLLELMGPNLQQNPESLLIQCAPDIPVVMGDKDRLRQVLINLVTNAWQASRDDVQVRLRVDCNGDGEVLLKVEDNGCGIPEEHLREIFTPFFTTKRHGTGLGLPVTRRIILEHGGKIEVKSSIGEGTVFTITLPPSSLVGTVPEKPKAAK
jgi:two-component system sensor kinase FixL